VLVQRRLGCVATICRSSRRSPPDHGLPVARRLLRLRRWPPASSLFRRGPDQERRRLLSAPARRDACQLRSPDCATDPPKAIRCDKPSAGAASHSGPDARAPEKVGSFLLDMATRCACGPTDKLVLPMSRYDIADYLALSVETVSRAMTDLQQRGAIALTGTRRVTIVDHAFQEADTDDVPSGLRTIAATNGAGRDAKFTDRGMKARTSSSSVNPPEIRSPTPRRGESRARDDAFVVAPACERGAPRPSAR
jgi:hypothetical protein